MGSVTKEKHLELFECEISREKLAATNKMWSKIKLNNPWMVGTTSALIQQHVFRTKEEWKLYYFETGLRRIEALNKVSKEDRSVLTSLNPKQSYSCKSYDNNSFNLYNGRTKQELCLIGDVLYGEMMKIGNPDKVTRRDCRYSVYYRVIAETWNGYVREENTMTNLLGILGERIEITKTSGRVDSLYAVDAEIQLNGKLVCAIQIKPDSYRKNFASNEKYRQINKEKNDNYTNKYGVPVVYIYSEHDGEILNKESIETIKNTMNEETDAK